MACPPITINGVTREVWECLRRQASGLGVRVLEGDRGSIHHADVDADYAWDEAAGTLAVTFTRTPAWIGCGIIESRLRQAARGAAHPERETPALLRVRDLRLRAGLGGIGEEPRPGWTTRGRRARMARYGRDFMGRVRGWWDRVAGDREDDDRRGFDDGFMDASGPGAEGYFLSREMAREADATMDYRGRGWDDDGGDRGFLPGGIARWGRAVLSRGDEPPARGDDRPPRYERPAYGADRPVRGGYDRADFFVNRHPGDDGYREGTYQRDLGTRGGMGYAQTERGRDYDAGLSGRGHRADHEGRGFAMGYDRGYRGGFRR